MKLIRILFTVVIVWSIHLSVFGQDSAPKWTRVQTDNGEFSIEVPEGFSYFYDKEGFFVGLGPKDYRLRDVNLLKGFADHTLVCFEVYRGDSGAVEPLLETADNRDSIKTKSSLNGVSTRKVVDEGASYYYVAHYFRSKQYIYIVTAASRQKDSPVMTRFFDSMRFVPGSTSPAADAVGLSKIQISPIDIRTKDLDPVPTPNPTPKPPDPDTKGIIVVSKPRASYIDAARSKDVQGVVRLRIECAANGFTPRIELHKTLPAGLARQALFAALRLKFLPVEKDGTPISRTITVDYSFTIF